MSKGFTPLIGLAVVVALALAAVFGALSIANPAMAAIGQPADAELTERTDSPQANPRTAYTGHEEKIDLAEYISGTGLSHIGVSEPSPVANRLTVAAATGGSSINYNAVDLDHDGDSNTGTKDIAVVALASGKAEVFVTPGAAPASSASITLYAMDGATGNDAITAVTPVTLAFSIEASTSATSSDIPAQTAYIGDAFELDLTEYFTAGKGQGAIASYTATLGSPGTPDPGLEDSELVTPASNADGFGTLTIAASALDTAGNVPVNVSATDSHSSENPGETFTLTVEGSIAAEKKGVVPNQTIALGSDSTFDVSAYFEAGKGTGAITGYSVTGNDMPTVVAARVDDDGMITFTPRQTGNSGITITAETAGTNPTQFFLVTVTRADTGAGLPGAAAETAPQSLMAMANYASIGVVNLTWAAPTTIPEGKSVVAYQVRRAVQGADYEAWATSSGTPPPTSKTETGLMDGAVYNFEVRAVYAVDDKATTDVDEFDAGPAATSTILVPVAPTFDPDDVEPGKNSWYTAQFSIDKMFNGGADTMTVKLEGFGVPSSIGTSSIAIVAKEPASTSNFDADPESKGYNSIEEITFNPASIAVDGKEIILTFPDVRPEGDITKKSFDAGTNFKVIIYQSAGVSNPTAARTYGGAAGVAHEDREIFVSFSGVSVPSKVMLTRKAGDKEDQSKITAGIVVPRVVQLDEEDGGLGDPVTATALGFENGGTLHFFLDKKDSKGEPDGKLNAGEDILCSVPKVEGNMGSCSFTVTTPTFGSGTSYVNAVDGDGKEVSNAKGGDNEFTLKASIQVTPAGGSPGEVMQVQLSSFPANVGVTAIKLSGDYICGGLNPAGVTIPCTYTVGSQGTASIPVKVPNWAVAGIQELVVEAGGEDSDAKVTIVGPRILPTPQTVVANQRISLVGSGFSPNSKLGDDTEAGRAVSRMSIGGYDIPWSKVNDGKDVDVDDGGNWSASLDLPLVDATTGTGERALRATDSLGRGGAVMLNLAARSFDITPESGRVGTLAVVRGMGYPSKNDEGHSFTIDVIYKVQEGGEARVSVVPDASGRFEVQLRVPTTASIPSTNQVEVSFKHESGGTNVVESKQHFVPEGVIMLSETSGGPGTTITINGEGFKSFVPVESVKIGAIEITPAPKPSTDINGMMEFAVLIPGLDVGIQTIEVKVGGTTSSTGFTVTESGIAPGDIKPTAEAVEDLGENLVSVWHFNNDTKVWAFYSPELADGNTLTHMITGETYLLEVKSTQQVILNRDTRDLTCVGGNCWNQIVW